MTLQIPSKELPAVVGVLSGGHEDWPHGSSFAVSPSYDNDNMWMFCTDSSFQRLQRAGMNPDQWILRSRTAETNARINLENRS